jgi:ABC-2 type transport system permease protein
MSPARPTEVILGKSIPLVVLFLLQQAILLVLGRVFWGMPFRGSVIEAVVLIVVLVAVEVAFGMLLVTICSTINQVAVFSYLGALLLAGFGGALTPVSQLPRWVQHIAPASPVYWALKGFGVVVAGTSASFLKSVVVLLAFAAGAGALTLWRYRFEEPKTYFP